MGQMGMPSVLSHFFYSHVAAVIRGRHLPHDCYRLRNRAAIPLLPNGFALFFCNKRVIVGKVLLAMSWIQSYEACFATALQTGATRIPIS